MSLIPHLSSGPDHRQRSLVRQASLMPPAPALLQALLVAPLQRLCMAKAGSFTTSSSLQAAWTLAASSRFPASCRGHQIHCGLQMNLSKMVKRDRGPLCQLSLRAATAFMLCAALAAAVTVMKRRPEPCNVARL